MKLRVEIAECDDVEITIRCSGITDEVRRLEEALRNSSGPGTSLALSLGKEEHFVPCEEILFFESDSGRTAAHTADKMYHTQYKLSELERLLPRTFARASKSCVINTSCVSSISHNPMSSSEASFTGTYKKIYISRMYYKAVRDIIEETRIRK